MARVDEQPDPLLRALALTEAAHHRFVTTTQAVPIAVLLAKAVPAKTIEALCLDGVLRLAGSQNVAFMHDLVFDYCLARAFEDRSSEDFEQITSATSTRTAILFRASIAFWLEGLWQSDRKRFWALLERAMQPGVPGVARIALADVLVQSASEEADLLPLAHALTGTAQETAIRFACGLAAADPRMLPVGPWFGLSEQLALQSNCRMLRDAAMLIYALLEKRSDLSDDQKRRANTIARALLESSWKCCGSDTGASSFALGAVLKTFALDSTSNAAMVHRLLTETSIPGRVDSVATLAMRIPELIAAPDAVSELFEMCVSEIARARTDHDKRTNQWLKEAYEQNRSDPGKPPTSVITQNRPVVIT